MHVLAFRHVPFETAGRIHAVLEKRGISIQYVDLYRGGACPPGVADAAGLIFLGGPMSANDDLPYLRTEMQLIAEARRRGQPVLGICLGAQLIAKACGAKVYRNATKEIGWFDLHMTEEGAKDRLFAPVDRTETVFHWHGETFDLPPGSQWLAFSERCRHQAFRLGRATYGLQFHLEVTPEMIADWCSQDENCGDVRELDAPIDPALHAERMGTLTNLVFGRWAELLSDC